MAKRNVSVVPLNDLVGGVDFDSTPFDVPQECIIAGSNVLPSLNVGGISQRQGIIKHNTVQLSSAFTGMLSYTWFGAEYFLAANGSKIYNNSPDGTWSDITGSLTLTNSQNNIVSMDALNGTAYGADTSLDGMWYWPRTGNGALISNPPTGGGTILCSWGERMWAGGNNASPTVVFFSALSNGQDYTGTTDALTGLNYINFDEGAGGAVTGIARGMFETLIVFKNKSISMVENSGTTPPFYKYLFADGAGCCSQASIVYLPGGNLMWWDTNDIYMLLGNQIVSATDHPKTKNPRMKNFFRNMVNPARLQFVCGAYYPNLDIVRYFFSAPYSNINNMHIDYHVKTRSWWGPGTLQGNCCCRRTVNGQERLYSGNYNGYAYWHDQGYNDDGSAINWNFQIPWQAFEGLQYRKKLDSLFAYIASQGNYTMYADILLDQNPIAVLLNQVISQGTLTGPTFDGTGVWDTSTFPIVTGSFVEASLAINQLCKSVSVNFHGSNSDVPVNILKILFMERPLQITRGLG
jgi:hypothetical protein